MYISDIPVVAVDLDGTLIKKLPAKYYKDNPQYITGVPVVGKVNKEVKRVVNDLYKEGADIVIYTARHWKDYYVIKDWLYENYVRFDRIVCGKFDYTILIDDRTVSPNVSMKEILKRIKRGVR